MYDAFAEAAEPCMICVMSRRDVEALIRSKPQIALRLLELVAVRMQELETNWKISPSAACRSGSAGDSKGEAPNAATVGGLTHQDLADMLGVYRETVTTALDNFRNNDIIAIRRRQLVLRNVRGCASWPQRAAELAPAPAAIAPTLAPAATRSPAHPRPAQQEKRLVGVNQLAALRDDALHYPAVLGANLVEDFHRLYQRHNLIHLD